MMPAMKTDPGTAVLRFLETTAGDAKLKFKGADDADDVIVIGEEEVTLAAVAAASS